MSNKFPPRLPSIVLAATSAAAVSRTLIASASVFSISIQIGDKIVKTRYERDCHGHAKVQVRLEGTCAATDGDVSLVVDA